MMKTFKTRHLLWIVPLAAAAVVVGCSKTPSSPSTTNTVSVMLTDSPFTDAQALVVTFSEVSAHMSGGDWVTLPFASTGTPPTAVTARTCDIKRLVNGATDVLGVGALTPGHYTQLRLTVSSATIYFNQATTDVTPCVAGSTMAFAAGSTETGTPVPVSSGQLILNRPFDVPSTGATTITLDFNGDGSVVQTGAGMYRMTPVITVVGVQ